MKTVPSLMAFKLRALSSLLVFTLAVPTNQQGSLVSPCPDIFSYNSFSYSLAYVSDRWFGLISIPEDNQSDLKWVNVVLDTNATLLGSWNGPVNTTNYMDFQIGNGMVKITNASSIRFYVQYDTGKDGKGPTPKLKVIRVNDKEICRDLTPAVSKSITETVESTTKLVKVDEISTSTTTQRYTEATANSIRNNKNHQDECGKVVLNKENINLLVVNGRPTLEGQWPWQIALYRTQLVDYKLMCGGTLVSRQHVITAAHCVTNYGTDIVVNKNRLTVYLGKHNLHTSTDGVQIRLVSSVRVHPEYNASIISKDLSILILREPVFITDWVRPACLWPNDKVDLSNVIGKNGSVVGWGYDASGFQTEVLTLVEMPVVDQETCLRSNNDFFLRVTSAYTFCAGSRDGKSVCNGDSGGGMVFAMQNTWYLRGLVSLSVAKHQETICDPTHYVVFTDLAKFLPWIEDQIDVIP